MAEQSRVMVIEDSATQAMRLRLILERNDFVVACYGSAEAALEAIDGFQPDLIMVDFHLPGMRGDEFARHVRMAQATRAVPVLLLTDSPTPEIEQKGFDSGVDDYIVKSTDPDGLMLRVNALLRRSRHPSAVAGGASSFHRARLLIVDDSATFLLFLRQHLEQEGYEVTTAAGGQEALSAAERQNFDCVVVDLIMPFPDGLEVCRRVDALRHEHDLSFPIVILTGHDSKDEMMRGFEAGADDFVSKSSDIAILKARIRALLRRKFLHEENQRILGAFREKESQLEAARRDQAVAEARATLMSELERSYAELAQTNEKLKQTQAQLIQTAKMASLGELVAGIAHEINNPLAYVIANHATVSKIVRELRHVSDHQPETDKIDKVESRLASMAEGLGRIRDIVLNLRTFSRLEEGKFKSVKVSESVDSVIRLLEHNFRGRIEMAIEYGAEDELFCSPAVLNQVVMNIVANAVDAIEGEGRIAIRTGIENGMFAITVTDNGSGIAPEIRDRIFEPFFTTKPVGAGTGLGLAISYSIVEAHRGTISVQSKPGEGSTFTIRIPLDLEAQMSDQAESQ